MVCVVEAKGEVAVEEDEEEMRENHTAIMEDMMVLHNKGKNVMEIIKREGDRSDSNILLTNRIILLRTNHNSLIQLLLITLKCRIQNTHKHILNLLCITPYQHKTIPPKCLTALCKQDNNYPKILQRRLQQFFLSFIHLLLQLTPHRHTYPANYLPRNLVLVCNIMLILTFYSTLHTIAILYIFRPIFIRFV